MTSAASIPGSPARSSSDWRPAASVTWFEQLLAEFGHQVWLGDASGIRRRAKRRQKNDRRDAELILDLLLRGEFPRVRLPPPQSREVLRRLRYRHRLIRMRTQVKNSLRALALSAGVVKKVWLFGPRGRAELFGRFCCENYFEA